MTITERESDDTRLQAKPAAKESLDTIAPVPPDPRAPALTFTITHEQHENASGWITQHIKAKHGNRHLYAGAAGGTYTWRFTQTGLGTCALLYCLCGDKINLTNFEDW